MEYLSEEQIVEKYEQLPQDLKEAIFSVEVTRAIESIAKKYNLYIDKIGALGNETGMVMLGVTHPKDFISNLSLRLNIDKETARKIAEEVNGQIFSKVRDSLRKLHGTEETSPPTPLLEKERGASEASGVRQEGEVLAPTKEDLMKEIEKSELPEILQGTHEPPASGTEKTSMEIKTKEDVFRLPPKESNYPHGDPYREMTE